MVLTDLLAVGENERGHALGREAPHVLLRRLRCEGAPVEMEMEFSPRAEYGVVKPLLVHEPGGLLARGGATRLFLSAPAELELEIEGSTARARFRLTPGDTLDFSLQYRPTWEDAPRRLDSSSIAHCAEETLRAWQSWAKIHQSYDGPWRELVHHSGRVLQGLTYLPHGRDGRRPHDLAPGGGGRRPQLGLSLLLGS